MFDTAPFLKVERLAIARIEDSQWTSVAFDRDKDRYSCEGSRAPVRKWGLPSIVTASIEIDDATDEVSATETFVSDSQTILIALSRPIIEVWSNDAIDARDDGEVAYVLDRCRAIIDKADVPGLPLNDEERRRFAGPHGLINLEPGESHISALFEAKPGLYWLKPSSRSAQPWPFMVARVTDADWTALHYVPNSDDFRCEGAIAPERAGGLPGIVRTRLHYDTGEVPPLDVDKSNHATIVPLLSRKVSYLDDAERAEQIAAFPDVQDYLDECRRLVDLAPENPE
ncbi:hypothetical protein [Erythrobacter sp. YT30]|uniref:hypothetical protein n=1 Tax=Erythrobacter sp. YT30 TaxID=1735012 RepID=UPI00076D967D|nr:hypothetical protein [Erythrobacter sp. YT30]KWV93151.1 hypothetical protein AUC45_03240 [Erythrobacter sp. YT30]